MSQRSKVAQRARNFVTLGFECGEKIVSLAISFLPSARSLRCFSRPLSLKPTDTKRIVPALTRESFFLVSSCVTRPVGMTLGQRNRAEARSASRERRDFIAHLLYIRFVNSLSSSPVDPSVPKGTGSPRLIETETQATRNGR